ncbi:thioredoxin domain-containing protein [Hymenobacter terricola]|uniref:thioredoxin n=1 Tax=Hymenobacter terricola TaxID=2819236 RepID=UPI001B318284|nr:thioredoxin [Hymenobacter terricola]
MSETIPVSAVLDTNDAGLRQYTNNHLKVFAKFTAENCAICELLAPSFNKFAGEAVYQDILFMRLGHEENPVARLLMAERASPFFVSYCQGRLLECNTHATDADVRAQLDRLRRFSPSKG